MYTDYKRHIDLLSIEEKGKLLDAIMKYAVGEETELTGMTKMAFSFITSQMDRDEEKYREICERRREAGAKGGIAKARNARNDLANVANAKSAKSNLAKPSKTKQSLANVADTDTDNVTDTENETETVNDTENETENESLLCNTNVLHCQTNESDEEKPRYSFEHITDKWNELEGLGITPIRGIAPGSSRETYLRARLKQYGEKSFDEIIAAIRDSDFLQGKHNGRPWQVSFDWVIKPSNYPKVLEGNYKNNDAFKDARQQADDFFADIMGDDAV